MNKSELIDAVAASADLPKAAAGRAIDAMIETVAEVVLNEQKPVTVVDANNEVVGTVHSSKVIHVLFGSRAET